MHNGSMYRDCRARLFAIPLDVDAAPIVDALGLHSPMFRGRAMPHVLVHPFLHQFGGRLQAPDGTRHFARQRFREPVVG